MSNTNGSQQGASSNAIEQLVVPIQTRTSFMEKMNQERINKKNKKKNKFDDLRESTQYIFLKTSSTNDESINIKCTD